MTHDPLCPIEPNPLARECRTCDLIAQVRFDMVQRVVNLSYYHDPILPKEHGYNEGREDAIEVLSDAFARSDM